MIDIVHRIGIKSPAPRVYRALTSLEELSGWWTEEVQGDGRLGGKIDFVFRKRTGDLRGNIVMEVKEAKGPSDVRWRCVEGPAEWIGTDVTFQLAEKGGQTTLLFGHRNWREAVEFTSHCSTKWATFLFSLREYVETGHGRPAPNDLVVDDWD